MIQSLHSEQIRVTSIPYSSSGYVIFSGIPLHGDTSQIRDGKYYVTIKARPDTLPAQPSQGQQWTVHGKPLIERVEVGDVVMRQHTYESPEHVICTLPETGEQLIQFIAKEPDFKGIGLGKARALWQLLGEQFHTTLRTDTPESRERLKGILSDVSINALFNGYAKYKNLSHCNWMAECRIPSSIQQRLLKFHGEGSVEAIKDNPYLLVGFGMEFEEVDTLSQTKFEVELKDPKRLSAALEFAIHAEVEKGHTYTTQARLRPLLTKLLGDGELAAQAFKAGYHQAQYVLNHEAGTYHPTAQLLMETVVAKRLLKLAKQQNRYDESTNAAFLAAVNELPYELTAMQNEAVLTALDNAVSCITGGAGTGKTTVLRTALRAYGKMGFEVHAVALSGRAAMRLHESIGFKTMTIAALLRHEPIEPSDGSPNHLLVIDEASMIDLPTMYRLTNHLHPAVRIIFTGDPNQLPPIGCGKVLADIVASQAIANVTLDIVKRQKGATGIPEYSMQVNQGLIPEHLSMSNVHFHETPKDKIAQVCAELYQQSPENSRVVGATTAMVTEINNLIQEAMNPDGARMIFEMYGEAYCRNDLRQGDVILFTQNNYEKGIQNGSLGKLTSAVGTGDDYGVVELDTGESVYVTQSLLDCMRLGYCITLHKAQGSQFPRIIIALQKGRIVDRAWIYTAITRAEHDVHIVGNAAEFAAIIKAPSNTHNRNSYLRELLKK
ncbi:AAA family ATPase [Aeromonas salmonicida]|uniref:Helicase domain protein n=1 Tax=Aeromonas salmonicida subsp. pectinolytica 34mel TaxID=1324960 RepID=T0QMG0_AERSA|nr:AAA family ATPase [Aeromonas salmonicida]ATP11206.1 helicase domain protein [Aeromonas salmonicida subsp. pectinolytica 34mel]EQC02764.1 AAA ATPase [Aeromonas salmonicida subsp. pectinolytica 34mel]TNI13124.1 AAA family ATPase [Aeromonas salmonicida]